MEKDIVRKHPCFGVLGFSRVYRGGSVSLFGSNVKHSTTIVAKLFHARSYENPTTLTTTYMSEGKPLFEVEMSPTQFADMMTSMNVGDGIPVTILQENGENIPRAAYFNKAEIARDESNRAMQQVLTTLTEDIAGMSKKLNSSAQLTRADRDEIAHAITSLQKLVQDQLPFIQDTFAKQMNRTVLEAKNEVDNYIAAKIEAIGIDAVRSQPMLEIGDTVIDL